MTVNTQIPTVDEVENMTDRQFRSLEARCRRAADRQGMRLVRSRRRDPRAVDYGGYWLIDNVHGGANAGGEWGWNLAEIAEYLWGEDE
jgi:hypothetical protein